MSIDDETKQYIEEFYIKWKAEQDYLQDLFLKWRSRTKTKKNQTPDEIMRAAFTAGVICGVKEFMTAPGATE